MKGVSKMAKREDVYENDYLENAEIFADLVNGVLYQGVQVVKPQELSEQDGELRSILGCNVKKIHSGEKKRMKVMLEKHREQYEKLSGPAKRLLAKLS